MHEMLANFEYALNFFKLILSTLAIVVASCCNEAIVKADVKQFKRTKVLAYFS